MTRRRLDRCLRALGARLTAALPIALPVLLAVTAAHAAPAPGDPPPPAGYVDGSAFAKFATEDGELIEVNVSGRILRALAGSMGTEGDPDAKKFGEMLGGLHSIRAIVTEIDAARVAEAGKLIESVAADLARKGWEEIAKVRSKSEKIRVLGLPVGDKFGGLTVMLVDDDEDGTGKQLIFANIAGPFDLSQLRSLEGSLNVPGLDAIDDSGDESDAAPAKDPKGAKGAR
jgi:hypothetical protein